MRTEFRVLGVHVLLCVIVSWLCPAVRCCAMLCGFRICFLALYVHPKASYLSCGWGFGGVAADTAIRNLHVKRLGVAALNISRIVRTAADGGGFVWRSECLAFWDLP